ncbi:MAG: hypothetical protein MZU91_08795 [Desulfosudis oleivorans]|nr:hypothetical protein [Desulfosudis oleivorans]
MTNQWNYAGCGYNENPDKDKIIALQKEARTLRDNMEDKATALRFEIHKILTPEQQCKAG